MIDSNHAITSTFWLIHFGKLLTPPRHSYEVNCGTDILVQV